MIWRILLTVGLALFAVAAVASGFDRLSKDSLEAERIVFPPFRANADQALASLLMVRQQPETGLAAAQDAVAANPIDPGSSALLGTGYLLNKMPEQADAAFRVAARFGWRNLATQSYWYEESLALGDYARAADRLDAILRAHPRLIDLNDLLRPMEAEPKGRQALVQHLVLQPVWLQTYLAVPPDFPRDQLERRIAVLNDPAMSQVRHGCNNAIPMTLRLLQNGLRAEATRFWNASCPEQAVSGPVADTRFCNVFGDPSYVMPFGWRPVTSGDVSVAPRSADEKSCGLTMANRASTSRLVLVQEVALPPGTYRFEVDSDEPGLATGALAVTWSCGESQPYPGQVAGDLSRDGQMLSVGSCDRQTLGLWLANGREADVESIAFRKIG